jgi:type II secretory pathway component PulF
MSLAGAEASGDFTATLEHVQDDYTRRVNHLGRKWVIIAGPVVVVILGLIVGTLAVSMFAPLIEIINQLSS